MNLLNRQLLSKPLELLLPQSALIFDGSKKIMKILGLKLSQTAIFNIFPVSIEIRKSENISTTKMPEI